MGKQRNLAGRAFAFFGFVILALYAGGAGAGPVQEVTPDRVEALVEGLQQGRSLAIHYTSDDGSCSHCVDNIGNFRRAAEELSATYSFATVVVNPWRRFFDDPAVKVLADYQKSIGFPLSAVPAIMVFVDGKPVRMITGPVGGLKEVLAETREAALRQDAASGDAISVAKIQPHQIGSYVTAFSKDRPLVLTLSSTDPDCTFCLKGNDAVDEASRYLAQDYNFARIDFSPWKSAPDDETLRQYLSGLDFKLKGLPTTLVFFEDQLVGSVATNGRDLRVVLSQALPSIRKRSKARQ